MITRRDLINFRDLPPFPFLVVVLELLFSIDHEFKDTVSRLSGTNRVLSILELDLSFSIKIDGISQIIVNECVHDV